VNAVIDVLRSIVTHEAGHAVTGVVLGMAVRKIEVTGSPDGLDGYSYVDHEHARLNDYMVMLLSGAAAEQDVMGFKADSRPHHRSDEWRIAEAIARVDRGQRAWFTASATQQARRLVRVHRPTVLALAGALFEKCVRADQPWDALEVTLTGDELGAALGDTALLVRRAV
jgi:hypothetical protein